MKLNPDEVKGGMNWLVIAGSAAILLSVFLQWVDDKLTYSRYDIERGRVLHELRSAQAALGNEVTDHRLMVEELREQPRLVHETSHESSEGTAH